MKPALPFAVSARTSRWKTDDGDWFEAHPGANVRLRPVFQGELEAVVLEFGSAVHWQIERCRALQDEHQEGGGKLVSVLVQLAPGTRARFLGVSFERRGQARLRLLLPHETEDRREVTLAPAQLEAFFAPLRAQAPALGPSIAARAERQLTDDDRCALCGEPFEDLAILGAVSFDHDEPRSVCTACAPRLEDLGKTRPLAVVGLGLFLTKETIDALGGSSPPAELVARVEARKQQLLALRAQLGRRAA